MPTLYFLMAWAQSTVTVTRYKHYTVTDITRHKHYHRNSLLGFFFLQLAPKDFGEPTSHFGSHCPTDDTFYYINCSEDSKQLIGSQHQPISSSAHSTSQEIYSDTYCDNQLWNKILFTIRLIKHENRVKIRG